MKRIALLGSTGSIGVSAIDVIAASPARFAVTALSADSNIALLAQQARRVKPRVVCIGDARRLAEARRAMPAGVAVVSGQDGLRRIVARRDVDLALFAIAGSACLAPLIEAIENRKGVALANKEALVAAGDIIMRRAAARGVKILPIDSEHSAVFQCLEGKADQPRRIVLTASGGPLLDVPRSRFDRLPRRAILRHPKWRMGRKISVDSATMMNKGLEIIEACRLFGIGESLVDVVIHPEAIIHSMVEFADGSVLGQMSMPDMRLPIQYALTYPDRLPSRVKRLDLCSVGSFTFRVPDARRFPCLGLARAAAQDGRTFPAVLNAADEIAVSAYLDGAIRFSAIPAVIEKVLSRHAPRGSRAVTLGDVLAAESWGREETRGLCYR